MEKKKCEKKTNNLFSFDKNKYLITTNKRENHV